MITFTVHDVILLGLAIVWVFKGPRWFRYSLHKPLLGFGRGLFLSAPFVVAGWLVLLAVEGESIRINRPQEGKFWLLCLGAALYVALAEELLLRGILQSFLERVFTVRTTLWLQGLTFTLLHIPGHGLAFLQSTFYFLSGVLLTLVLVRWRNIWTAIGIHFAWDVSAFALQGFDFRHAKFAGLLEPQRQWVGSLTFTLLILIALIILIAAKETQIALTAGRTYDQGKQLAEVKNGPS